MGFRVVLATQTQCGAYLIILSESMDYFAPHGHLGQHLHISNAIHPLLGTGQGHTSAIRNLEKTHLAFWVTPHQ